MNKARVIRVVIVFWIVFGLVVGTYSLAYGFYAVTADIQTAQNYLWRARSCDNLEDIAWYMQKALKALENRHGNPDWLYHLPDTDFDLIKRDLERNIQIALNISKTAEPSSYGYQRTVDNIQEIIVELNEHLDECVAWLTYNSPCTIILVVIYCAVLIALLVAHEWYDW